MRYTLIHKREGNREELFDSLDAIASTIEGIDWASGDYAVFDDDGVEYEARWIREPKERRLLGLVGIVDVGSYELVPKCGSLPRAGVDERRIAVRPVERGDAGEWLRMRASLWPDDTEAEHAAEIERYFAGEATGQPAVFLAFDAAGEALGFAELAIRPFAEGCKSRPVAYLEGWYVVPHARRRGIGKALVAAGAAWGRSKGCTELASDTAPDNAVSIAAHRALGFDEAGLALYFRIDL